MEVIHLYARIRQRQIHAFPAHFFVGDQGMRYAGMITRYLLEEKLAWNRKQICLQVSHDVFARYQLAGMLKTYFKNSILAALNNAYPDEFHPRELVKARRKVFSGPSGREMARRAVSLDGY